MAADGEDSRLNPSRARAPQSANPSPLNESTSDHPPTGMNGMMVKRDWFGSVSFGSEDYYREANIHLSNGGRY